MSDYDEAEGLRERLTKQGEDTLGKLAEDLMANPLVAGALQRAFDAREKAARLRVVWMIASHLFEPSTTRIAVRRNAYLRRYVYDFIELFAPHLSRDAAPTRTRTSRSASALPSCPSPPASGSRRCCPPS